MNYWLILIPVLSALVGWLTIWLSARLLFHPQEPRRILGITIQGIIPRRRQQLAEKLGKAVSKEFLSFSEIEKKISDPHNLEKLMPVIETHVDEFLRDRLGKQMPMISMFIGDKTIGRLKQALMEEIGSLFPLVMQKFASNLQSDLDLEQIVVKKVTSISPGKMEDLFHRGLSRELHKAGWLGAAIGLIIGVFQVAIILLTS